MDESGFRSSLIEWDAKSLDDRVARWKQISPATYTSPLPSLLWEYLSEADEMYINGHFLGTIPLCATIIELVIADQLKLAVKMNKKEVERFGLEQMIIVAHKLHILNDPETNELQGLRKVRNALVHGDAGKLGKMAKIQYQGSGLRSDIDAAFYVKPIGVAGIREDARRYIQLTRNLSVKFYGE